MLGVEESLKAVLLWIVSLYSTSGWNETTLSSVLLSLKTREGSTHCFKLDCTQTSR